MKWEAFDAYEIRARLIPTLIVISPLLVCGLVFGNRAGLSGFDNALLAVVLVGVLYSSSFYIRSLGTGLENRLVEKWGGFPSAKVLLPDDHLLDEENKKRLLRLLRTQFEVPIDPKTDRPEELVLRTQAIFDRVRQILRNDNERGIWKQHNDEYGAIRNFTGATPLFIILSFIASVSLFFLYFGSGDRVLLGVTILMVVAWLSGLTARVFVQPKLLKRAAETYAKSAWLCFISLHDKKEEK